MGSILNFIFLIWVSLTELISGRFLRFDTNKALQRAAMFIIQGRLDYLAGPTNHTDVNTLPAPQLYRCDYLAGPTLPADDTGLVLLGAVETLECSLADRKHMWLHLAKFLAVKLSNIFLQGEREDLRFY